MKHGYRSVLGRFLLLCLQKAIPNGNVIKREHCLPDFNCVDFVNQKGMFLEGYKSKQKPKGTQNSHVRETFLFSQDKQLIEGREKNSHDRK